jgi:2-isopropylmalate synthase
LVSELTGVRPAPNKPVVGENIFTAESGIHQDGLLKDPASYLPFLPEQVGAGPIRLVLGKHSGRRAVRHRMQTHGVSLSDEKIQQVLAHLKHGARKPYYDSENDLDELLAEVFPDSLHTREGNG